MEWRKWLKKEEPHTDERSLSADFRRKFASLDITGQDYEYYVALEILTNDNAQFQSPEQKFRSALLLANAVDKNLKGEQFSPAQCIVAEQVVDELIQVFNLKDQRKDMEPGGR